MKNSILLFATLLFIGISTKATTIPNNRVDFNRHYNNYGKYFTFQENGITFSIYKNGQFDFYLNAYAEQTSTYYQGNGVSISYNGGCNYQNHIQRDRYNAIIQIENTPIFYDSYGRVIGIGNVSINYYNQCLQSIGGLYINFDRYGNYSHCSGYINAYNRQYVYRPYYTYFRPSHIRYTIVRPQPYRRYYKPTRTCYKENRSHGYAYGRNKNQHSYKGNRNHSTKGRRSVSNRRTTNRTTVNTNSRRNVVNRSLEKRQKTTSRNTPNTKRRTNSRTHSRNIVKRTIPVKKRSISVKRKNISSAKRS